MNAGFFNPYTAVTALYQPWKFGEDPFSSSWDRFAPRSTIKKYKNTQKTSAKYMARRAGMPGGLKEARWH